MSIIRIFFARSAYFLFFSHKLHNRLNMKGLLSMNYHRERKHIHELFNDRSRLSLKSVTTENTFLTVLYF